MSIYDTLASLNITLPPVAIPAAAYVPFVQTGNLVFLSGTGPYLPDGGLVTGKVGGELTVDEGQLPRGPHLVAGAHGRDVGRHGCGDGGQGDLQALEARGDGRHQFFSRFM